MNQQKENSIKKIAEVQHGNNKFKDVLDELYKEKAVLISKVKELFENKFEIKEEYRFNKVPT